jgi:hypothetical protein
MPLDGVLAQAKQRFALVLHNPVVHHVEVDLDTLRLLPEDIDRGSGETLDLPA